MLDGDSLLAVGDEELVKIHFHTNTPLLRGKLLSIVRHSAIFMILL